jgi:glutamyl-tRNA synthetase
MLNYLALLGWSIAEDRDVFSLAEMVAAFDVADVNANPARFDPKKCEAINATHIRLLEPADFANRLADFVAGRRPLDESQRAAVVAAAPLVQERIHTLADGAALVDFLLSGDDFAVDEQAAAKQLGTDGQRVLTAALAALEPLTDWSAEAIESALHAALVDGLGLKPRHAYGPLRVAVTGRTVSPPLFESMALLGGDRSLGRLRAATNLGEQP